jgi:hypothetical protein
MGFFCKILMATTLVLQTSVVMGVSRIIGFFPAMIFWTKWMEGKLLPVKRTSLSWNFVYGLKFLQSLQYEKKKFFWLVAKLKL